jgi:hypothetical protein
MKDLFQTMSVFAPKPIRFIIDLEVTPRVDFIEVDLITSSPDDDITEYQPKRLKHAEFENWLSKNGHLTPEYTIDRAHTVTGLHVQETYVETLDYSEYLRFHLDKNHVYECLRDMGRTNLKFIPE